MSKGRESGHLAYMRHPFSSKSCHEAQLKASLNVLFSPLALRFFALNREFFEVEGSSLRPQNCVAEKKMPPSKFIAHRLGAAFYYPGACFVLAPAVTFCSPSLHLILSLLWEGLKVDVLRHEFDSLACTSYEIIGGADIL